MAEEQILQEINNSCNLTFSLQSDTINDLTNNNILELHREISKTSITLLKLADLFKCSQSSLRKDISVLKKKVSSLRGIKKDEFLSELFFKEKVKVSSRKCETQTFDDITHTAEIQALNSTIDDLKCELNRNIERKKTVESKNIELRNQKRMLKRQCSSKQNVIESKRARYNKLMTEFRKIKRNTLNVKEQVKNDKSLKKKIISLEKSVAKLDEENKKLKNEVEAQNKDFSSTFDTLETENCKLKDENKMLRENLSYTETLLNDNSSNVVSTYNTEKNCYTTDMQLCVMNLLTEGVGVHHVNNVIKHVSEMCGKKISNFPSVSTINRIGDQRASVSYKQISEQLGTQKDTTLQSDETRKHGDCYEVFSVRDSTEKTWVLGLKDMRNKSSENCLKTLKSIVDDISECTSTNVGNEILTNIKNTMSDRAATEKKFHELLKSYREEILPRCYSNWDLLTAAEQESVSHMNNFYCGLHILVNFAEVSDGVILKFEDSMKEGDVGADAHSDTKMFTKKGESSSIRLVRTACKSLARGGDDKSGCYSDFRTFMNDKDSETNRKRKSASLLEPFRGNRFNILFYNAEIVFFLADHIIEFFEKVNTPSNRLQKAVYYDINVKLHLAVLKALGICSKFVTAPFWRALEDKDCSLEKANSVYQSLYAFLERSMEDSSDILCGNGAPMPELVKKDEVYERLMQPDEFDSTTCALLQQLFAAWHTLIIKAAGDHLLGGSFSKVDESLSVQTQSVPRHNKFPERVFSLLDALTRFRPIASTLCNESYIMFSLNKTGQWVNSLPKEEKEKLLDASRKEGIEIRKKYQDRIKDIENNRREDLRKKRIAIEKKEHEKYIQREKLTDDMLYYGLWQYPETVDSQLKTMRSDAEKKKALKCQLQFRKIVLGQPADKKIFQFSEKGVQYNVEKLTENVKTLIKTALEITSSGHENIFCGKKIIHFQMVDNVRTPFHGRVVSTVPGYPNWYNVIYEGDPAVYVYMLADDYKNGDLQLVVEGSYHQYGIFMKCYTVVINTFVINTVVFHDIILTC